MIRDDQIERRLCALEDRRYRGLNPDLEDVREGNRLAAVREYEEAHERYLEALCASKRLGYSPAEIDGFFRHSHELLQEARRLGARI